METQKPHPGRVDLTMVATMKALLDTRQVSKAAEVLGVSQPSVSQTLRRLRDYFDDELFIRSGNNLHPTPRAQGMEPLVSRMMKDAYLLSQAPANFDPALASREFVVSLSDISEFMILPRLMAVFAEIAPNCTVKSLKVAPSELVPAMERGEVDIAAGTLVRPDAALKQQLLAEYELVCVTSLAGRWTSRQVSQEDFLTHKHVNVHRINDTGDPITERFLEIGIHRRIALAISNHFAAAQAIVDADLICTLPKGVAMHLAQLFAIRIHPTPFSMGSVPNRMVWHQRMHKDSGHQWLRRTVADVYRDIHRLQDKR